MKFTLERWACLESLVKEFQWFCSFYTQEPFCSLSWCKESCFMAAEGFSAWVVLYPYFHPVWSSGWPDVWIWLRGHTSLLPFPWQCQGRAWEFAVSAKWAACGDHVPQNLAAGCSHQAVYTGAILGHPFLTPTLYLVDKERGRHEMPLLSVLVLVEQLTSSSVVISLEFLFYKALGTCSMAYECLAPHIQVCVLWPRRAWCHLAFPSPWEHWAWPHGTGTSQPVPSPGAATLPAFTPRLKARSSDLLCS